MERLLASILFISLLVSSSNGQLFQNLDLNDECDSSKTGLCQWDLSWGAKDACSAESGNKDKHLLIQGDTENAVGFAENSVSFAAMAEIQILEVAAKIRTEDVLGKGAGLNVGLYNASGDLLATKDMGGFYSVRWLTGDNEWTEHRIQIICPVGTAQIKIGAILYGKGKARFDDYKVWFSPIGDRQANELAKSYVSDAVDIIAEHSLIRDSLDIEELKADAISIAGPAKDPSECHLAIDFLLGSLAEFGDHHSFFMSPEEADNWENNDQAEEQIELPEFKEIEDCAYILVPPFHGGNEELIQAYADSLQQGIQQLDGPYLQGWIVDLRENTGGNMEPMILGLGPLFSQDQLGALIDVNGMAERWYYRDGAYYWEDTLASSIETSYNLKTQWPIAVLTGPQTGSSGEIVVISFIGNKNTRSFGEATWGLTTGNGDFVLADGAKMFLASTIMADRNGKHYTSRISPDETVIQSSSDKDDVLEAALLWIQRQ